MVTRLCTQLNIQEANVQIDRLPISPGIPAQLEWLFYHLVVSAIKFVKKDELLSLLIDGNEQPYPESIRHLSSDNAYVEILPTDNGIRIEPSQLEKIADLFFRLHTPDS